MPHDSNFVRTEQVKCLKYEFAIMIVGMFWVSGFIYKEFLICISVIDQSFAIFQYSLVLANL